MPRIGPLDDEALFARLRGDGDEAAREELVSRHLPRAHALARRFTRSREPVADLEQVAGLGLLKAVDRYVPGKGSSFWSFATPTVVGEMKRYMRDSCWRVHVARPLQERSLRVQGALGTLTAELGRSPSTADIAIHLGWSREDVVEALEAASAFEPDSLDAPVSLEGDAGAAVGDLVGTRDKGFDGAERRATLAIAMRSLDARDRAILRLRFAEDLTQTEIAEAVGISQMHVSRLIRRALGTLRRELSAEGGFTGESLVA